MDVNNNSVQDALDAKQNLITSTNKLDYSLLNNTPTIPTVREGELTIKVNGTTIETFGANQGDDDEIDISIPTESTVSG